MPDQKSIFLVEDDRFLSSLLKSRLEREGMAVVQSFDGEEALSWLKGNKPDLVILDLIMPKVSGFEVMETIALDPRLNTVPVVILSNLAQDSDVQRAQRLGVKEYFVKVRTSIDQIVVRIKAMVTQPA